MSSGPAVHAESDLIFVANIMAARTKLFSRRRWPELQRVSSRQRRGRGVDADCRRAVPVVGKNTTTTSCGINNVGGG